MLTFALPFILKETKHDLSKYDITPIVDLTKVDYPYTFGTSFMKGTIFLALTNLHLRNTNSNNSNNCSLI